MPTYAAPYYPTVVTEFYWKHPLSSQMFNKIFMRFMNPGVLDGLEVRIDPTDVTKRTVLVYSGTLLIKDSNSTLFVKSNFEATSFGLELYTSDDTKYRLTAHYEYSNNSGNSNAILLDFVVPGTEGVDDLVICDLIIDGASHEILFVNYDSRDFGFTNDSHIERLLNQDIGVRPATYGLVSTTVDYTFAPKLVYNKPSILNRKYSLGNIENVTLTNGEYLINFDTDTWDTAMAATTRYFVFLVVNIDMTLSVKVYSEAVASWDQATMKFTGVNEPFHRYLGEFYSYDTSNIYGASFCDSYLNHEHGEVKMFHGMNPPLGWRLCESLPSPLDGSPTFCPDMRGRFPIGYEDSTRSLKSGVNVTSITSGGGVSRVVLASAVLGSTVEEVSRNYLGAYFTITSGTSTGVSGRIVVIHSSTEFSFFATIDGTSITAKIETGFNSLPGLGVEANPDNLGNRAIISRISTTAAAGDDTCVGGYNHDASPANVDYSEPQYVPAYVTLLFCIKI